jgi:hypothetical protein
MSIHYFLVVIVVVVVAGVNLVEVRLLHSVLSGVIVSLGIQGVYWSRSTVYEDLVHQDIDAVTR